MKRILIIHPEGNIANNLNLYAIVQRLSSDGVKTDYLSWKKEIPQKILIKGFKMFLAPADGRFSDRCIMSRILRNNIKIFSRLFLKTRHYSLIIGVDEGIIVASKINDLLNIPHALISYEIFPYGECDDKKFKEIEIKACENIIFAVTQDAERAKLLSKENKIAFDRIIKIPLGGLEAKRLIKDFSLHEKLGIPKNKKIVMVMGSIAEWAMTERIIEDMSFWDENWVLVVHGRYKNNNYISHIKEKCKDKNMLYFSEVPVETCEDMENLLSSVHVGIAMYKPLYKTKWDGMNIEKIGMSSGKIATFLRHGVPIITNEIGVMSDNVEKFELGRVVKKDEKLTINFTDEELINISENCIHFYDNQLCIEKTIENFMSKIEELR